MAHQMANSYSFELPGNWGEIRKGPIAPLLLRQLGVVNQLLKERQSGEPRNFTSASGGQSRVETAAFLCVRAAEWELPVETAH